MNLPEGIHSGIPEAAYHADPAAEISASSSVLRTLYAQSPLHAWTAHPRLNPAHKANPGTDAQNAGTILHALVLGTPAPYRELAFDSYRTQTAKDARDAVIEKGLIPILDCKFAEIAPVADALCATLERDFQYQWQALTHPSTQREVTLIWREGAAMCRCRFDALPEPAWGLGIDLKFTGLTAEPEAWSRKLREDYLMSAALYPRAVKALRGDAIEYQFIVCETAPPYGVSVHSVAPDLQDIGARRLDKALGIWRDCMASGKWPSYPALVHYATAPSWFAAEDDERAVREQIGKSLPKPGYNPRSLEDHSFPFA